MPEQLAEWERKVLEQIQGASSSDPITTLLRIHDEQAALLKQIQGLLNSRTTFSGMVLRIRQLLTPTAPDARGSCYAEQMGVAAFDEQEWRNQGCPTLESCSVELRKAQASLERVGAVLRQGYAVYANDPDCAVNVWLCKFGAALSPAQAKPAGGDTSLIGVNLLAPKQNEARDKLRAMFVRWHQQGPHATNDAPVIEAAIFALTDQAAALERVRAYERGECWDADGCPMSLGEILAALSPAPAQAVCERPCPGYPHDPACALVPTQAAEPAPSAGQEMISRAEKAESQVNAQAAALERVRAIAFGARPYKLRDIRAALSPAPAQAAEKFMVTAADKAVLDAMAACPIMDLARLSESQGMSLAQIAELRRRETSK